jgi:xanthine dehydrogenase YagS FAD-binding subunit
MQPFEYANPATLQEALGLLAPRWGQADVLAGGTDLVTLMKQHIHEPQRVVNIKNIKELGGIQKTARGLRIGALTTMKELADSPEVRSGYKSLADAAAAIPSPQIRHMGTAGGDLCQRPRCWYFRRGYGLLAMQDGKPLVPEGENMLHAIFGDGPAYFVSASSLGPALVALGARVKLASAKGTREVEAAKFFVAPKTENQRETVMRPDEILTEIVVPPGAWRTANYEVREKESLDWPLAAAAVALQMKGNTVSAARIVLGHVAPTPWDVPAAAKTLVGKSVTPETADAAGKAAVAEAKPLSQNAYKVQLAHVAVKRALLDAVKARA